MDEPDLTVPPQARARLLVRFGEMAGPWCDTLPQRVRELAGRWRLTPLDQFGGGTSRVYLCRTAGGAVAYLKLTADPDVARTEAEALRLWRCGGRTPEVLSADTRAGALLLVGITAQDGAHAPTLAETAASGDGTVPPRVIAPLLAALREHAPCPDGSLPSLAERVDFVFDLVGRRLRRTAVPGAVAALAGPLSAGRAAARDLARSGPARLVHGDLHAGNVLDAGGTGGLFAIDPRPCVGDPDFDAVDWVLLGTEDEAVLRDRVTLLAGLVPGLRADRLLLWCAALAVLVAAPKIARGEPDGRSDWLMRLPGLVAASR